MSLWAPQYGTIRALQILRAILLKVTRRRRYRCHQQLAARLTHCPELQAKFLAQRPHRTQSHYWLVEASVAAIVTQSPRLNCYSSLRSSRIDHASTSHCVEQVGKFSTPVRELAVSTESWTESMARVECRHRQKHVEADPCPSLNAQEEETFACGHCARPQMQTCRPNDPCPCRDLSGAVLCQRRCNTICVRHHHKLT